MGHHEGDPGDQDPDEADGQTPESISPPELTWTAVHQATETLTQIACADHGQIRAAAQAGRLLVPTRSLPDHFDIPHPFAPAPRDRVDALLNAYHHARTASAPATAAVDTIAAEIGAPSHIRTLARAATKRDSEIMPLGQRKPAEPEAHDVQARPGPVEGLLHDLGVADPGMLRRGCG